MLPPHLILLSGVYGGEAIAYTRPIGCYQLKHWLSHFGIRTQVIEFCGQLTSEQILQAVRMFVGEPTVCLGVSTSFWRKTPPHIAQLLKQIREEFPNLKIVSGGARETQSDLVDEVFSGESEDKFAVWMQELLGQKGKALFNRKFQITELAHRFDHTDCIMPGETLPIELGRGCIFKCKFCAHHNLGKAKHTYQRRHELLLDEMRYNKEQFGTTKYMFLDDTVNEDNDKVRRMAQFKRDLGFDIEWQGYLRADLIWSQHQDQALLDSGMKTCLFGIETFHLGAGRAIDKPWGAKHGRDYLPKLYVDRWGKSINIYTSLIAGLPGETYRSLQDTVDWFYEQDLGYTRINPLALYINFQTDTIQSEFTQNYDKYGYKNVRLDGYWENEHTNLLGCLQFCEHANTKLTQINRVACWSMAGASNVLNTPYSDLVPRKVHTVIPELRAQQGAFVSSYLNKLRLVAEGSHAT